MKSRHSIEVSQWIMTVEVSQILSGGMTEPPLAPNNHQLIYMMKASLLLRRLYTTISIHKYMGLRTIRK